MIELLNKKHENGDTTTIKFNVKPTGKDVVVTFVVAEFSDGNKWRKEQVLTEVNPVGVTSNKLCSYFVSL